MIKSKRNIITDATIGGSNVLTDVARERESAIMSIDVMGVSKKMAGHLLYEVTILDAGHRKVIPVVAVDVAQVVANLDEHIILNIPEATLSWMLGNERNILK